ncbi:MAG: HAMP domain-containing histidine kinase [Planctomycetes bacterium]|nr:HAMP domain-containing histidine kinase [Planctomycetota bacterium]
MRELEAERARLTEQVLHLERVAQVGLMTSGLAHDLVNQLTGVLGTAELALMRAHPSALREGLDGVLVHAGRMHDTVDAFLSFVRRREHRVRYVSAAEVVDAVQRLVQPVARSEGVVLLSTAATTRQIRADRQLLEQAVVNLVLNAVRAASRGAGRVSLTAVDGAEGRVRFSVRDAGPGIPESVRSRLFEPFVTDHGDGDENGHGGGGHGLGLYVVRQVAERYGGRIDVESSAAGTRIDLDFPAGGG